MTDTLSECNEKNYCLVDHIQPFALLFVVDQRLDIKIISANATMFGTLPQKLLGKNLLSFIDGSSHLEVFNKISELKTEKYKIHRYVNWKWNQDLLSTEDLAEGFLFSSNDYLCFEIVLPDDSNFSIKSHFSHRMQAANDIAFFTGSFSDFALLLTKHLQIITGFDRLYFLQFDSQRNGMVIGESSNGFYPSLAFHHFPASDIPANLHEIYCLNRFRHYPHRNYQAVPLLTEGGHSDPLDLTFSISRQVGASHLKYLENMGVAASMSFSVVVEGKLWGLVGGHHRHPKRLPLQVLLDVQNLVELCASKINMLAQVNQKKSINAKLNTIIQITQAFKYSNCNLIEFAEKNSEVLKNLIQADALIWADKHKIGSIGISSINALPLFNFAKSKIQNNRIFATDSLIKENSPLLGNCIEESAGILALSLNINDLLIWSRVEQLQQKKWSGNPSIAIQRDSSGVLNPRHSFATWVELVSNTSNPWDQTDISVASELGFAFANVKLNQLLKA